MPCYVDVLPEPGRAFSQLYTYHVPEHLRTAVRIGSQALIPFGPRTVLGFIVGFREDAGREIVKDIEAVLEHAISLPEDALPLARWIADYYLCELGEALRLFLPQGATYRIGRRFRLTGKPIPDSIRIPPEACLLIRFLVDKGGDASLSALVDNYPGGRSPKKRSQVLRILRLLKANDLITETATLLRPAARTRRVQVVEATCREEVERYCQQPRRKEMHAICLRTALETGPLTVAELSMKAGASSAVIRGLVRKGLLRARWREVRRVPWKQAVGEVSQPILTSEQMTATNAITAAVEAGRAESFLLHGVTASGKTEVFLRSLEQVISLGRQAIVLMPEISLTAQALSIYRARFGDRVAILHSALSLGERWDEWQRIQSGEAAVVIGARSALFAPTERLGLIVVDEEHEASYKQEQAPRYHAREVALERGQLNNCPVILASATPALESFYAAAEGRHRLLKLPTRVERRPMPKVRVIDMRGMSRQPAILSTPLRQGLLKCLQSGEQAILFLNRRGFATFLLCPACGEGLRCPHCGVALTFHKQERQVKCHHCSLVQAPPDVCEKCGGHQIRFSGFGTERVERELAQLFSSARIGRLDRDTTAHRGAHVEIVGQFRAAETDILIGTQMVAKGFDFPGVTLVGVVSADTSLNLPDFRAAERTFQLLTQVAGRSGRGDKEGEVIIQTYRPEHYSIKAAAAQDYELYYQQELITRRELKYPPFSHLINLVICAPVENDARERAKYLAECLRHHAEDKKFEVLGPATAPIARLRGMYRWHLLVKGEREEIQVAVREVVAETGEWVKGSLTVEVDPVSLM